MFCSQHHKSWHPTVTRSQNRSNFEIDISPSILELERRSKAHNTGITNGYLCGKFNFRYHFRWKKMSRAQNGSHFENFKILSTASIWPQVWKDRPKLCHKKSFFMMMMFPMTSQGGLNVGPPYYFINEITTFFINKKTSTLNFLCIGFRGLWLHLYKHVFMTSLWRHQVTE